MSEELLKTLQFIALLLLAELALLTFPAWAGFPAALAILLFTLVLSVLDWSVLDLSRAVREKASAKISRPVNRILVPTVVGMSIVCVGLFYVYG